MNFSYKRTMKSLPDLQRSKRERGGKRDREGKEREGGKREEGGKEREGEGESETAFAND